MSHLGDRVTALVDGQLPLAAAERAVRHLADCPDCREAVELERLTKQRLQTLIVPDPGVDLLHRLLDLSGPAGPLPPRPGHVPGSPRPRLVSTGAMRRDAELVGAEAGRLGGLGRPDLDDLDFDLVAAAGLVPGDPVRLESVRLVATGVRPPSRRDPARPPVFGRAHPVPAPRGHVSRMAQVTRSSRNRVAAAVVGAACLVGAGVVGSVAGGGGMSGVQARVVPPVDSFVVAPVVATSGRVLSSQAANWVRFDTGR